MFNPELTILIQAREIISDPQKWTREAPARDSGGSVCGVKESRAVCWCSVGVLMLLTKTEETYFACEEFFEPHIEKEETLASFNDSRTHKEVLELWGKAIASAKNPENTHGNL